MFGGAAAVADPGRGQSSFWGRPRVTPLEYDFLRKSLKERSGLVLSADKQYLVESRLLPIARKSGFVNLSGLIMALRRGDESLMMTVVESMTTNETFFFRDRAPFDNFRTAI